MKNSILLVSVFMLMGYDLILNGECDYSGQKCFKTQSCGFAQECPFGGVVEGTCSKDLVCMAEGDTCTLSNRDVFTAAPITGTYQKNPEGKLICLAYRG